MTRDWQTIVVAIAVLWAVLFVARRLVRLWRRPAGGCGSGCQTCPSSAAKSTPLVTLDLESLSVNPQPGDRSIPRRSM